MKKIIAFAMCLGILSASSAAYAVSEITGIVVEDGYVNISGKSDSVFGNVSYTVVPEGAEVSAANAVSVGETVSDENGDFKISVKADFSKSLWSDGDYTVSLRVGGGEIIKYDFYYYSTEMKSQLKEEFLSNPSENVPENGSALYKTFLAKGVKLQKLSGEDFENLTAAVLPCLENGMEDDDLVNVLNKGVITVISNKGEEPDSELFEVYEDFEGFEAEKQSWILKAIPDNGKYKDVRDFEKGYELVKVLCEINFAKHSEISDLLKDNREILDLDSNVYEEFSELSSVKKGKVCEKIADKLKLHDAYTVEDIEEIIEDAVESADKKTSSSGGGGGSGSGGSSQGFVTVKPAEQKTEQPEVNVVLDNEIFTDLDSVSWAKEAVEYLYNKGIVTGVTMNTFEPSRFVTREEFAAMLVRAAGLTDTGRGMNFADVNTSDWYYESVKIAYSNGVTTGVSENVFGAGTYITRQDMAVMVARVFDIQPGSTSVEFKDSNEISDYAEESISKLCSAGVISGMGDGMFSPTGKTTRAQAATVIYRIIGK